MKKKLFVVKFFVIFLAVGFFSPSVKVQLDQRSGLYQVHFTVLNELEARRGGGGMRGGGMRGGGMRSSGMRRSGGFSRGGGRSFSRGGSFNRSSPSRSRYQGGNFPKSNRASFNRPVSTRPAGKPSTRPVNRPSTRPVNRPVNKPVNRPVNRPVKPGKPGVRPPGGGNRPGGPGHRPPGHRPHPGHHHHHHYPHHGWGGYWPWFWGSAIVVGAIVSTIPDDDCRDLHVDGKWYKECEGVLFEPVYQGNDVQYKVVEINKK